MDATPIRAATVRERLPAQRPFAPALCCLFLLSRRARFRQRVFAFHLVFRRVGGGARAFVRPCALQSLELPGAARIRPRALARVGSAFLAGTRALEADVCLIAIVHNRNDVAPALRMSAGRISRSEEHTSELQSLRHLV